MLKKKERTSSIYSSHKRRRLHITLVLLVVISLLGGFEFLNPFRTGAVTTAVGTINRLVLWTGTGSADVFGEGTSGRVAKWTGTFTPVCTPSTVASSACTLPCGGGTQSTTITAANCSTSTGSQSCNTQACAPTTTGNIIINATKDGVAWTGPQFLTAQLTQSPYGAIGCTDIDSGNSPNHLPKTFANILTGSYTFAYCPPSGPPGATFTGITPNPQTLGPGETKTFTFNFVTPQHGLTTTWSNDTPLVGTVTFSDIHNLNATASFSTAGIYVLRLTAFDTLLTTSDTMTVTVLPAPVFDYSLAANPTTLTIQQGNSRSTDITAMLVTGSTQPVTLSAGVSPIEPSITTSFPAATNPCSPTCTSALTINTSAATPTGTYTVTVTGSPLNRTTGSSITVTIIPRTPLSQPTLTFSADRLVIRSGTDTTLRWTVGNDATSCTAGGDWSGSVASSNGNHSQPTGNLTSQKTYTLFCSKTGAPDSPTRTVTITISTSPVFREIPPQ